MLYIIAGIDDYQKKRKIKEISVQELGEKNLADVVYMNLKDTTLENVFDEAMMLPLFADKKVMVVEGCEFLMKSKKNAEEGEAEAEEEVDDTSVNYETFLANASLDLAFTTLILVVNGNVFKTKKGMKEALKSVKLFEFNELKADDKAQFINAQCIKNGLELDESSKHYLNEILPADSFTIIKEIEKLSLYGDKVDKKVIDLLISKPIEQRAYLITEAVLNKDTKQAFNLLAEFKKANITVQQTMATLASQLRTYYQVATLRDEGMNKESIAQEMKLSPGRMYYLLKAVNKYSPSYILRLLNNLSELDLKAKSGKMDLQLGFELFLLKVGK